MLRFLFVALLGVPAFALLPGCSWECDDGSTVRYADPGASFPITFTPTGGEPVRLALDPEWSEWRRLYGDAHMELQLKFGESTGPGAYLWITLPKDLADGTYPLDLPLGTLPGSDDQGVLVRGPGQGASGTLTFSRSRNAPWVDVDATEGVHPLDFTLTFDVEAEASGGAIRIEPVPVTFRFDVEVGSCSLADARLGGH